MASGAPTHGGTYGYNQLMTLAERAGANAGEARVLAAIALAESGGNPFALSGHNRDGSQDHGLWQINDKAWAGTFNFGRMTDPLYNAKAALRVLRTSGYGAWTTYSTGAYRSYLPGSAEAQAAGNNSLVQNLLDYGMQFLGVPYQWGGSSPQGFDCSGLVQYVYKHFGINLPRVADQQEKVGQAVSFKNARAGDLVWFDENPYDANGTGADHIGIYLGNGKMLVAPHTGSTVKVESIQNIGDITGFTRVLPGSAWGKGSSNFVYSGSGAGGGGGLGGFVPALNPAAPSRADVAAGLDAMGFASALINSDPSLKQAFNKILQDQLDLSTPAGQDRATAILEGTKWFRSRTDSQRKYDEMRFSDPKEYQAEWNQKFSDTQAALTKMGFSIDPKTLHGIVSAALRNNLSDQQVAGALASHFSYNPKQSYTGTTGDTVDTISKMAEAYYHQASPGQIQDWVRKADSGQLDPSTLQDFFKQQALSMFPYLKPQLDAGLTVADVAQQYKNTMGQVLELNPDGISNTDPTIMKGLQAKQQDGTLGLMPLWQYQQELMADPRWQNTNNAKNSLVSVGADLLKQWGLTA